MDQTIPAEGRALLDTLASGEAKDYNVANGGGTFSSYADHPFAGGHRAAGRYQFLPSTWKGIQKETGLGDFSPANQDKGAWYLAQRDYKAHTGRDLQADLKSGDPATIANIGRALHPTWVSLNDSFSGKYRRFLGRDAAPSSVPSSAPGTTVGDAAYMAAEQRRAAGSSQPGDADLMARYRQQQATPTHAATSLAHPQSHPVRVELTDTSAQKIHRYGHEQFDRRIFGAVAARSSAKMDRMFNPSPLMPNGIGPSSFNAITNHNTPTVHQQIAINGVQDPYSISDHLKVHATRGVQDGIRTIQGPSG